MKRTVLIATALLLMLLPLAGCGVPQEDLDAAEADRDAALSQVAALESKLAAAESAKAAAESALADAESALAAAESDLAAAKSTLASAKSAQASAESAKAAAESDLADAESALADAEAEVAALEAQVAELEAEVAALEAAAVEEEEVVEEEEEVVEEEEEVVEEEEEVVEEEEEVVEEEEEEAAAVECPAVSFAAATYTNDEYSFSVSYPDYWVPAEEISEEAAAEGLLFSAGTGAYNLPGIAVKVLDVADYATFEDLLTYLTEDPDMEIASSEETTTADGTAATQALVYYISGTYPIDGYFAAAQKDGKWFAVYVYTITMYFPIDEALAFEIVGSLCLQ
jgi:chemotaxis protein histidine kinase CheA